jgi:hypothetical protein
LLLYDSFLISQKRKASRGKSKPAIWDGPGRDPFYPVFSPSGKPVLVQQYYRFAERYGQTCGTVNARTPHFDGFWIVLAVRLLIRAIETQQGLQCGTRCSSTIRRRQGFLLLGDSAAVTAMLDLLPHHGYILKCGPRSWRGLAGSGRGAIFIG